MTLFDCRWIPLLLSIPICSSNVSAVEFAVENTIFQGQQILGKSVTLFTDEAIYDVLVAGGEQRYSIYSPSRERFRVLDLEREIQLVIAKKDLDQMVLELTERAKRETSASNNFGVTPEFIKFAASPVFTEELNSNRIVLKSKLWTYDVEYEKIQKLELATEYRKFADAFVCLNAIWSPIPPNPRLRLNERLGQLGGLPKRVRVITPNEKEKYSEHEYQWSLSKVHEKYISDSKNGQLRFPVVGLNEFRRMKIANIRMKSVR